MKEIEKKTILANKQPSPPFFSNYYICFYTPRAATDTAFCSAGSGDISKILDSCQCTTLVTILHRFEFEFWKKSSLAPFVVAVSGRLNFKLDSPHIVRNWVNFVTAPTLPQLFQYFYAALDDFTQFIIMEVLKRDFRKGKFGFCLCCPVLII